MAGNAEYQKGYAAGRRTRDRDRFDRFYAAAMTGLLSCGGWQRDGKEDRTPYDFAKTAKQIAEAMVKVAP